MKVPILGGIKSTDSVLQGDSRRLYSVHPVVVPDDYPVDE